MTFISLTFFLFFFFNFKFTLNFKLKKYIYYIKKKFQGDQPLGNVVTHFFIIFFSTFFNFFNKKKIEGLFCHFRSFNDKNGPRGVN
jgi:predicted PurR-regulated permease PerM